MYFDNESKFVNISRMTTRTRPEGCCPLQGVAPLPAREQERWARLFKALGDPNRLEILRLIAAQSGPTCVCDIVERFDLAQPTISHHLKLLREAGLLSQSRIGVWSFYAIDPAGVEALGGAGQALLSASRRSRVRA
jgi:ArsR family transcriptional regulator